MLLQHSDYQYIAIFIVIHYYHQAIYDLPHHPSKSKYQLNIVCASLCGFYLSKWRKLTYNETGEWTIKQFHKSKCDISYIEMTNTKSNKEFKQEGLHLRFLFIIAFEITKGNIVYCSISKSANAFIVTTTFAICWRTCVLITYEERGRNSWKSKYSKTRK